MKSLFPKLGVTLLVMGLTTFYAAKLWGADWQEFTKATTGTFYYDKENISSPSKGFVRVWMHNTTKHETSLLEFDCTAGNYKVLDLVEYDETLRTKDRHDYYDNPNWLEIPTGSVPGILHILVCP